MSRDHVVTDHRKRGRHPYAEASDGYRQSCVDCQHRGSARVPLALRLVLGTILLCTVSCKQPGRVNGTNSGSKGGTASDRGVSVSYTNPDGTTTTALHNGKDPVPTDYPKEPPVYARADIDAYFETDKTVAFAGIARPIQAGGKGAHYLVMESLDPGDKVIAFYRTSLETTGWTLEPSFSEGEIDEIRAAKGTRDVVIQVRKGSAKRSILQCIFVNPERARALGPALLKASLAGNLPVIQQCLDDGVNINWQNGDGVTALMLSAAKGHDDAIKTLLSKGADIKRTTTSERLTALMFAADYAQVGPVNTLLAAGAPPNAKDKQGYTALVIVAVGDGNGNKERVRQVTNALVKHGASTDIELSIPVFGGGDSARFSLSGASGAELFSLVASRPEFNERLKRVARDK